MPDELKVTPQMLQEVNKASMSFDEDRVNKLMCIINGCLEGMIEERSKSQQLMFESYSLRGYEVADIREVINRLERAGFSTSYRTYDSAPQAGKHLTITWPTKKGE